MLWIDDTVPHEGTLNMAIDEVLLRGGGWRGEAVLRTYRWARRERSIGYFSPLDGKDSPAPKRATVVRRMTGGGVVEHGDGVDLTFSLVVPAGDRLWALPGGERYREIHEVVVQSLRSAGVECRLAVVAEAGAAQSAYAGGDCYTKPVQWDVLGADDSKLAGGGQRRRRDGLLHQGSVRASVSHGDFYRALARGFNAGVQIGLCESVLVAARELERQKYATEGWLRGRAKSAAEPSAGLRLRQRVS